MGFWGKLQKIDRRIIFIIIALVVFIPLLKPMKLPLKTSPPVKKGYDAIESLPEGARVLLSFDYGPSTAPELYPASLAILKHCFRKNLRVVVIALWPDGLPFAEDALGKTAKKYKKIYGTDFIILGYKYGGAVVVQNMGSDFLATFPEDFKKKPVSEFPIMQGVKNYSDFSLIVSFSAGTFGIKEYILFANTQYGIKVIGSTTAVSAPDIYPYYMTGQLTGLLGGIRGSAEYEKLINEPGKAMNMMTSQSFAHLAIIVFVAIANLAYFLGRKRRKE